MIESVARYKVVGVRVLCKLANLFNVQRYSVCVANYFGNSVPSSGGSGSGGNNPPSMA